jgi:MFS family permease
MNRHLALLALCQGFFLTNNVVFIAINGLVGLALAPSAWMATLPVTGYVVGGALSTSLVARSQRCFGRKRSFQLGLLAAAVSTAVCAWGAASANFWLLVAGTLMAGYYSANASLYRFAATELAAPAFKEKAISLVLAGGILGGVLGPNLANLTKDLFAVQFAGAYAALVLIALASLAVIGFIRFPEHVPPSGSGTAQGRSPRELLRQPGFVVAILGGALGYGVMNLLMSATPLAMQMCKTPVHAFADIALVLEWHVIGMFVPGFFTGGLIKRFGVLRIMGVGVLLNLACVGVALTGTDLMQFLVALFVLGVGWNFLFVGGTTLLTQHYRAEEKTQAQATMDFWVFATMAASSFSSGALITTQGWTLLNLGSLLPIVATGAAVVWLATKTPSAQMPRV